MALLTANKKHRFICSKNSSRKLSLYHKVLLIIILIAMVLFVQGFYREGKAMVAQQLLSFTWASYLEDGEMHKAWLWADGGPIAQLTIAGQAPLMLLSGASPRHLSFAPALILSSSDFGQAGNSVVVAHNDTHFKQLKEVQLNSFLTLKTSPNLQFNYQVIETKIVNEKELSALEVTDQEILTLITCYPFESRFVNSELCFVLIAKRIKQPFTDIKLAWLNKK